MRNGSCLFVVASLIALAGAVPADAAAQPVAPKPGVTTPPAHETSPADDIFAPPLRGTPGGRISGGTRGIGRPKTATPPTAGAKLKSEQEPVIPVAR